MKGGKKTTGVERFTKSLMTDFVRNATHAHTYRQTDQGMKLNRLDNNEERRKMQELRDNATREESDKL